MQASDPLDPRAVLGAAKAQPGNAGASRKPSATAGLDRPCARRDRRSAGRDLVDAVQHGGTEDNYPPCNVERLSEDRYQISLAVAGFSPDEIAITAEQSVLTVEGRKAEKHQREFLYQGISSRPFQAAVQPSGLRPGQGRGLRQRPAADRTGPRDPGGHEAASDFDRGFARFERPADRRQGGGLTATRPFHITNMTSAAACPRRKSLD
jgi:HSP20 family molecular chaperone IbpA